MLVATRLDKPLTPLGLVSGSSTPGAGPQNVPFPGAAEPSSEPANDADPASPLSDEEKVLRQIRNLPPELAVLLLSVGVMGFVLPGIIGTPAIIAGGLALWPKAFGRAERWFEKRCPLVHRKSLQQMARFLVDLDRRYPQSPQG